MAKKRRLLFILPIAFILLFSLVFSWGLSWGLASSKGSRIPISVGARSGKGKIGWDRVGKRREGRGGAG